MTTTALIERMATVETHVETMKAEVRSVADRLDRLQFWIMATFGGVVTGVFMMGINLLVHK